jgi:hypothetical protein
LVRRIRHRQSTLGRAGRRNSYEIKGEWVAEL